MAALASFYIQKQFARLIIWPNTRPGRQEYGLSVQHVDGLCLTSNINFSLSLIHL